MKKKYIDSSSSGKEKENQLINKIKQVSYYSYLACTILDFKYINNAAEFETKLGLILHNLANRLFKSTNINNLYKQIKKEKLSLSDDEYNEILNDVIVIFNKYLNQFFNNIDKKSLITDKDYIDLFNFVFDKNVNLPQIFILKNAITITNVRETLYQEIQNSNINLKPLFCNPLTRGINNPIELIAFPKLASRNNKNGLKYTATEETNIYSLSTTYKISNSKLGVFTDAHILHYKTGNVQTEKFGFGNYKDIFQEILHNEEHKENIVKRIFEAVQNKENSHLVLPKKLNNFAEQLTYLLFIIEMQRNNTTLFTAPMFLELTIQNSKYLKKEGFFLCPQKLLFLKQGG